MGRELIDRFSYLERLVHWVVGVAFVVLFLTGLAFSYPSLFWMTAILGGGPAARVLHPWVGVVFGVGMGVMLVLWFRDMFLDARDVRWIGSIRYYATHQRDKVPPAGKYNAGQKLFFWLQGILAVVFVISGVLLWMPDSFGRTALATARLLHYTASVGGGLLLVLHVYLGTIAYPGTARGMIDGKVTPGWAALHHPAWYEEQRSGRAHE